MADKYLFKIFIVGDSGVGKSSLAWRFMFDRFRKKHISTHGFRFFAKMIKIEEQNVRLAIWDISGNDQLRHLWPPYYRSAVGVLLVYDVSNYTSFIRIRKWYLDVVCHCSPSTVFLLVGNKCDLAEKREVQTEEAKKYAEYHKFLFIEISALTRENVEQAFENISNEIFQRGLGGIYYLVNESTSTINDTCIPNLKYYYKRPRRIVCGGRCIWPPYDWNLEPPWDNWPPWKWITWRWPRFKWPPW